MGLLSKEKISSFANKAKDQIKESYETAKEEQQKRKELGLYPEVTIKLEYKGGHPMLQKEKDCQLKITNDNLTISYGISHASIEFSNISNISFETAEQISRRITATRLITLGVFAFAFKKKKKDNEKYLTIEFLDNDMECAVLLAGKNAQMAYSRLYERYTSYKQRNKQNVLKESEENISNTVDPYDELKKLKELLDMGIISQDEFDKKKSQLLNI